MKIARIVISVFSGVPRDVETIRDGIRKAFVVYSTKFHDSQYTRKVLPGNCHPPIALALDSDLFSIELFAWDTNASIWRGSKAPRVERRDEVRTVRKEFVFRAARITERWGWRGLVSVWCVW
jgi:hypothetical protein